MQERMDRQDASPEDILIPTQTKEQKINFIIERQKGFPSSHYMDSLSQKERDDLLTEWDIEDRNIFYNELDVLHEEEFARLFTQERRELQKEIELYLKPANAVLLERWLPMDAWSPTESLSLWLGSVPRPGVDLGAWAERNSRLTMAAVEVAERWNLIRRALWVGALSEPLDPRIFMQWAANKKRSSPGTFSVGLSKETTTAALGSNGPKLETEIARLGTENERLSRKLSELDKPHYELSVKLFGALCVGIYGFDAEKKRNRATAIITKVVSEHWNGRDDKTVREYIRSSVLALPEGGKKFAALQLDGVPTEGKSNLR